MVIWKLFDHGGYLTGYNPGTEVGYSPEREDPGNPQFTATNIPKVVGGHTPACMAAGKALYSTAFDQVVPVSSTQVAELTKLCCLDLDEEAPLPTELATGTKSYAQLKA